MNDAPAGAGAGFADPTPHVAQRNSRDKLRFPPMLDDLGYLRAVVAPPPLQPAVSDQWLTPQYDASPSWPVRAKLEHEEFMTHHYQQGQGAAALSLTLSSATAPAYGGSLQSVVGDAAAAAVGPLGPFTGYAAVLKGSRFLRPAQQLLDEICSALVGAAGSGSESLLASPSSLSSSTDTADRNHHLHRPEFREKKARLLYMQEEVRRGYKQYHQQMQMVASLFESVPGLSCTTPYASSVLEAISKHFRRVRSIISSQIQNISGLLGEELLSLPRGGKAVARLGLAEQSQPLWRPQRGLPERAVSVLRAWLFDHFLHPYPTDADKHMLASQTGLSRNQVSNWFINARVRVWKPMVEEIHMLEASSSTPSQYQMLEHCLDAATQLAGSGAAGQPMMSFGASLPLAADMGGGIGAAVSLTLGLRHQQQQQQQQQFGGHVLGDLVG